MAGSQSRFTIVERLTYKKLEIMRNKLRLEPDIKIREQDLINKKKAFENWKKDSQESFNSEQRKRELEIEEFENYLNSAKKEVDNKEKFYDEQIKIIDSSLKSIETISEITPQSCPGLEK